MLIAIDYDGTLSADVPLWRQVAQLFLAAGHDVAIVSARSETLENRAVIRSAILHDGIKVILTNHNPKKAWCDHHGILVDVWIDDNPRSIFEVDDAAKWHPTTT